MPKTLTPANCTATYAADMRVTVEQIEAAFASVLDDIEAMWINSHADTADHRRTASTCYVEALTAWKSGNVESAAVALHCARFWATGRV